MTPSDARGGWKPHDPRGERRARRVSPRSDAYAVWALATSFAGVALSAPHAADAGWVWLLLEVKGPAREFAQLALKYPDAVRVPTHYRSPPSELMQSRFCTAIASQEFVRDLILEGNPRVPAWQTIIDAIERFELGHTTPELVFPADPEAGRRRVDGGDPAHPLVAVLDDGLAFANRRFCRVTKDGRDTRFLALWDQDACASPPPGARRCVCEWGIGRVHPREQMNRHIEAVSRSGAVDEDAVYQCADYRALRRRITHGTHVLDLACGEDALDVPERAADIIGVQLPGAALVDTSCASSVVFLLDALHFVLAQANAAGTRRPLLINISLSNTAGAHDGHSIFEEALDEIITASEAAKRTCNVVMAAGNSNLSRCHGSGPIAAKARQQITWRTLPDDGTPSYVELWFSPAADVRVSIRPPGGLSSVTLASADVYTDQVLHDDAGRAVASVSLLRSPANAGDGSMVCLIAAAPTIPSASWPQHSPAGLWQVTVENLRELTVVCDAYVQRDDVTFGRRGAGRQSRLEDANYKVLDERGKPILEDDSRSFVRREGAVNGLATGKKTTLVGARRGSDDTLAPYSSKDARRSLVTAVADDSPVLQGVLASGTRSHSVVAMNGTSVAAPQVVRRLAEGPRLSAGATKGPGGGPPAVPPSLGAAKRASRRRGGGP